MKLPKCPFVLRCTYQRALEESDENWHLLIVACLEVAKLRAKLAKFERKRDPKTGRIVGR